MTDNKESMPILGAFGQIFVPKMLQQAGLAYPYTFYFLK